MSNTYVKMPKEDYQTICDSLREYTGLVTSITSGEIPNLISQIGSASIIEPVEKDINFYDNQGIRLYSYTLEEANNNDWSIPEAPISAEYPYNHWCVSNEYLLSKRPFIQPFDIGLIRRSTNQPGAKLWITIKTEVQKSIQLYINSAGNFTIDWGDMTQTSGEATGSTDTPFAHQYTALGDYVITITTDNSDILLGSLSASSSNKISMFGPCAVTTEYNHIEVLKQLEINERIVKLLPYALQGAINLEELNINNNNLDITDTVLCDTYKLKYLALPPAINQGLTLMSSYMQFNRVFQPFAENNITSYSLQSALLLDKLPESQGTTSIGAYAYSRTISDAHDTYIPEGVTSIGQGSFQGRVNCSKYYLPASLTSMAQLAFRQNPAVTDYYIKATTPPTLANANAFLGISNDCKIHVPQSSLNAYKEATNWSTYADYMVVD